MHDHASHLHPHARVPRREHHNEALRMALGSILSPKRPALSRTTSVPASGIATSGHATPFDHSHSHNHTPAPHSEHHNSSPLKQEPMGRSNSASQVVAEDHLHAHETGAMTPESRARFVETLKGKSPWDALIHGSFA
ncbi:hypothetical protein CYLTODRAFT_491030 [Cylindrobasidium torrendii FP15055 ss-10]|uniref:Uncharacterized protein n=1 Tax=Cylindrobasidium torrendii FP15055 ss-10 TaxID=1314674 RepID=A0A0D7B8Y6_9AGAR|nr:hypothetical protein CYLTODRAFT_491030 [Cylindrobasidium torrendii FP15055 ss-10]